MSLDFKSFRTESGYDKLEIIDGPSENSRPIGTFSGSSIPYGISSTNETLYLEFKSDAGMQSSGFEIEYRFLDEGITQFL